MYLQKTMKLGLVSMLLLPVAAFAQATAPAAAQPVQQPAAQTTAPAATAPVSTAGTRVHGTITDPD
jgi:hypothetical protein